MRSIDNLWVALRRLRHRPVRSILLLQGTIWGVAVSLFPTAVMNGTREMALSRGSEIGADRITFAADPTGADAKPLSRGDVPAMRSAVLAAGIEVRAVAGMSVAPGTAPSVSNLVYGPPDAPLARGLALSAGRLLDPAATSLEVVVEGLLAHDLATTPEGALGNRIPLENGREATVVGVLAPRAPAQRRANDQGFDTEHPVFKSVTSGLMVALGVPITMDEWKRTDRCAYLLAKDDRVDWIYLRVDPTRVRDAAKAGERALLERGKDPILLYPPLYPLLLAHDLDRFKRVSLALFLACLVMGGVVMANVGLLAALRRAPEVAVHRVEGARQADVLQQFVYEGLVLSVVGASLGLVLSCGLAEIRVALEPLTGFTWVFPWPEASVAFGVSVVIGVLAGTLPALRAARADPVEGLSNE